MAKPAIPAPTTIRRSDPTRSASSRRETIELQQAREFTAFMDNLRVLHERCEQIRSESDAFLGQFRQQDQLYI